MINVLGEINTISDLPSYTKYWRNKFERRLEETGLSVQETCDKIILHNILTEYTTCLQMNVSENESMLEKDDNSSKPREKDFYFLSDVLPEDKVRKPTYDRNKLAVTCRKLALSQLSLYDIFLILCTQGT